MNQFLTDLRFFEETVNVGKLKTLLANKSHDGAAGISERITAMKWLLAMLSKGRDMSVFYPDVVKNVVVKSVELKKLVYIFLIHYTDHDDQCRELALLSVNTFQKDMIDSNPLIRALALRTLTSIRVIDIVPIQILAVEQCSNDHSAYVRKITANALPKIHKLEQNEQYERLILILKKLLQDYSLPVVSSALQAFEEICPHRHDLLHASFRRFCKCLIDLDEWGQITLIRILIRYCRCNFINPRLEIQSYKEASDNEISNDLSISTLRAPTKRLPTKEELHNFYELEATNEEEAPKAIKCENKNEAANNHIYMDDDHKWLLRSSLPLLHSRNSGVVLSVVSLLWLCGKRSHVALSRISEALVRLCRSSREVQHFALKSVIDIIKQEPSYFKAYLHSFYIDESADASNVREMKLDILVALADENNVDVILREMESYVSHPSKSFVISAVETIGKIAEKLPTIADRCMEGLVMLTSSSNEVVVVQTVVVIRKLLETHPEHIEIAKYVVSLLEDIKNPCARASILWIATNFIEHLQFHGPEMLRRLVIRFTEEDRLAKIGILNFAARLALCTYSIESIPTRYHKEITKSKTETVRGVVKDKLLPYLIEMALYDLDYDIRDRARFLKGLYNVNDHIVYPLRQSILLGIKSPYRGTRTSNKPKVDYCMSSMSNYLGRAISGYIPLPEWATEIKNKTARDVIDNSSVNISSLHISSAVGRKPSNKHVIEKFYESAQDSISNEQSEESESDDSDSSTSSGYDSVESSNSSKSSDIREESLHAYDESRQLLELFDPTHNINEGPATSRANQTFMIKTTHVREHILLHHIHGQGLHIEYIFPRNSPSDDSTAVKLRIVNKRNIPFKDLSVISDAGKVTLNEKIDTLRGGESIERLVYIDFRQRWDNPVAVTIKTDRGTFQASISAPIGDLLVPIKMGMTIENFEQLRRTRLSGMHQSLIQLKKELPTSEAKHMAQILNDLANAQILIKSSPLPLRFVATLAGDELTRVLIRVDHETVSVNSDNPMLSSRLLEDLKKIFVEEGYL